MSKVYAFICLSDAPAMLTPLLDAPLAVCPLLAADMISQFSYWAVKHFAGGVSITCETHPRQRFLERN